MTTKEKIENLEMKLTFLVFENNKDNSIKSLKKTIDKLKQELEEEKKIKEFFPEYFKS